MTSGLPYRQPQDATEPPDPEAQAFEELARRARMVRLSVGLSCAIVGVAAGVAAYLLAAAFFLARVHAYSPYVNGLLAVLPAGLITRLGATRFARLIIARRARAWVADIVAPHALDREALEHFTRSL